MKKKKFLTRILPAIIVIAAILLYLFIFRDNFIQGMEDAMNNFKQGSA
jgi:hypothetical protein